MITLPQDGLESLFCPRTVAVVGASRTRLNLGTAVLRHLQALEFSGKLYAIHESATEISGVAAVHTIADIPGPIDYLYVSLAAEKVEPFLRQCAGRVRFAQVASSGFSEIGNNELERSLLKTSRAAGIRLVGPNCLGIYCPRCRLTFIDRASPDPGEIAFISQSGGLATDVIRRGGARGIRFSKVVTVGNAIDLGPNDFLEYFSHDSETQVVGLYIENVKNGRLFLELVSDLSPEKPTVVLRGGVTSLGRRSAASHTGTMVTDHRLWEGVCKQAGVVTVDSLEALLNVFAVLQSTGPSTGNRVVFVGPGGGASVLAADASDRLGFVLPELGEAVRRSLAGLGFGAGTSLINPVDLPVGPMAEGSGKLAIAALNVILRNEQFDLLVVHLNLQNFISFTRNGEEAIHGIVEGLGELELGPTRCALVLRSSGEPDLEWIKHRERRAATTAGIPTFDSIDECLGAYARVLAHKTLWETRKKFVS